eukprot:TRINITY_DN4898_c1_g1_i1.p1 TRINITY_DN4898_c1_g1~~TRINITY_DN4898_c1_g1_i1.p1  ORF type:complete len:501 (+),score=107.54 TRINITY_DN4898_c1_g1_i1:50-1552(+)
MSVAKVLLLLAVVASVHGAREHVDGVFIDTGFMKFVQGYNIPVVQKLGKNCVPAEAKVTCGGFACVNNTCAKCTKDSQCAAESAVYACNVAAGDCVLRPLEMSSLTHDEVVAGVLAFFVTALAAVAGIGGGGMLVPLYILAAGFPPSLAVSMSQATILGCSGLNLIFMLPRKHPEDGPLIDYNAVMILIPMTLSGTIIGHMIGNVLPDWIRLVLLVLLLSFMLKRTLAKAAKAAGKETKEARSDEQAGLLGKKDVEAGKWGHSSITDWRFRQYPAEKYAYCLTVWVVLVMTSYGRHYYVSCGTTAYWVYTAGIVLSMIVLTAGAGFVLKNADEDALRHGYVMRSDEVVWNTYNTMYYPVLSITAGIGASLLGIGGGMILGILLFEMSKNIKPEASAATASVATSLVASKACMEFYFYGELPLDYALYFVLIGCLGTCLGQGPIGAYIKYKNKSYWIVYALALVIAGSLVALAFAGVLNVYKTWTSGGSMGLGTLCPKNGA